MKLNKITAQSGIFFSGNHLKQATDIVQYGRGGGGGQRQDALGAELPGESRQLQVVGAEVVPPLGDTVGLVHRKEGDPYMPQALPKAFVEFVYFPLGFENDYRISRSLSDLG